MNAAAHVGDFARDVKFIGAQSPIEVMNPLKVREDDTWRNSPTLLETADNEPEDGKWEGRYSGLLCASFDLYDHSASRSSRHARERERSVRGSVACSFTRGLSSPFSLSLSPTITCRRRSRSTRISRYSFIEDPSGCTAFSKLLPEPARESLHKCRTKTNVYSRDDVLVCRRHDGQDMREGGDDAGNRLVRKKGGEKKSVSFFSRRADARGKKSASTFARSSSCESFPMGNAPLSPAAR